MDPNATLAQIRSYLAEWEQRGTLPPDVADELANEINALDNWLSRGGFLPDAWMTNRPV